MSEELSHRIEGFLYREAWLLDERRFEDWRDLFTEDGRYWVPAHPDQTDWRHEVSLFLDDKANMTARIARLRHPRAHAQLPPSRTLHSVTNVHLEPEEHAENGDLLVRSALAMAEWRQDRQTVYYGQVRHRLAPEGGEFRIRLKRVDLINAEAVHGALSIPF